MNELWLFGAVAVAAITSITNVTVALLHRRNGANLYKHIATCPNTQKIEKSLESLNSKFDKHIQFHIEGGGSG